MLMFTYPPRLTVRRKQRNTEHWNVTNMIEHDRTKCANATKQQTTEGACPLLIHANSNLMSRKHLAKSGHTTLELDDAFSDGFCLGITGASHMMMLSLIAISSKL